MGRRGHCLRAGRPRARCAGTAWSQVRRPVPRRRFAAPGALGGANCDE